MILTLSISTLRPLLIARGSSKLQLLDVPAFVKETLGLNGLHLTTERLSGFTRTKLEQLRDRADKAACACLVLQELSPQSLADARSDVGDRAINRVQRVIEAAHVLGCNAAVISISGKDDDAHFERAVDRIREAVETAERLEINLLIAPTEGLTEDAERVTDMIKKIGRFRVMTYPDFETASKAPDPIAHLRRLTPYAGAVVASTVGFKEMPADDDDEPELTTGATHVGFDLDEMVQTVLSVGYDGPLAVDYRGEGDVTMGAMLSREALEAAIETAAN